ncbi:MAG: capsule assembly Wzi family protein [Sphaerochaetaceae bacterium]
MALAIFVFLSPISPQSTYSPKALDMDSPVYDLADTLYRVHRLAIPSTARPWSMAEAAQIIRNIPDDPTTNSLKHRAFSYLETALSQQGTNDLSYRFGAVISLESYFHTNTTDYIAPKDWQYSIDERQPLINLSMELQWDNTFYFRSGILVGTGATTSNDMEHTILADYPQGVGALIPQGSDAQYLFQSELYRKRFNTNILTKKKEFESNWPQDSQIAIGKNWWNVSLGRGRIQWGAGESGNLILGGHLTALDNLNISFFSKELKLQLLYVFLPNPISLDESAQRIFLGHRLEARPFDWLSLSLSESVMFKGESFPLNYCNPTILYHNIYRRNQLNSIAGMEADVALLPGLSLHAQFVVDQYKLPTESNSEANALGRLVNLTYSTVLRDHVLTLRFERVITDPCLYHRDGVDFLFVRGLRNNDDPLDFDFLGYQWGSDSQVSLLGLSYELPGIATFGLHTIWVTQGELGLFGTHTTEGNNTGRPDIYEKNPSGDVCTRTVVIGFSAVWRLLKAPVRLYSQIDWINRKMQTKGEAPSPAHQDFQWIAGMSISL